LQGVTLDGEYWLIDYHPRRQMRRRRSLEACPSGKKRGSRDGLVDGAKNLKTDDLASVLGGLTAFWLGRWGNNSLLQGEVRKIIRAYLDAMQDFILLTTASP
jgi:hypothetical protein